MAKLHEGITPELRAFIEAQPLFFVASAPLSAEGHVNLSPKGLDTFRVLSPDAVAYLDLTGSGNETAAHLRENGRVTFLFCAFEGPPRILRLYGAGEVVHPGDPGWAELEALFPRLPGVRQVVRAEIERVQTSCGFAVPLMELVGQRDTLVRWAEAKGEGLPEYRRRKNARSIDGLPAPLQARDRPAAGSPVGWETVVELGRRLPGIEEGTSYGTPALRVRRQILARLREDGETLVLRTNPFTRHFLLEADPAAYFLTDHYRDHPYLLARLPALDPAGLAARLEEGWRLVASRRAVSAYDAGR